MKKNCQAKANPSPISSTIKKHKTSSSQEQQQKTQNKPKPAHQLQLLFGD